MPRVLAGSCEWAEPFECVEGPGALRLSKIGKICACPLRLSKDLKNGSLSKLEDGVQFGADERQGEFAEWWKGQRVVDVVADARLARLQLVKDVTMHPLSIGSFQLLINKFEWGIPAADSRPPAQRQTVQEDGVIDEGSFFHANWHRRANLEAE